jgi:hypothetical protein
MLTEKASFMEATQAWLFVRGSESVRIIKLPQSLILLVCGPGRNEDSHRFESDLALERFRESRSRQLLNDGWLQHFSNDRRADSPRTQDGENAAARMKRRKEKSSSPEH